MAGAVHVQAGAQGRPAPSFTPVRSGVLQRCGDANCTCGCKHEHEAPPIVNDVLASAGRPLDGATREAMEQSFGHDFGRVRVHADSRAGESARAVGAHAYTVGPDIVFADGRYAPSTSEGRRLLTHELTHVVQQRSADHTGPLRLGHPDDAFEREAARSTGRVGLAVTDRRVQRLGANPSCTEAEADGIHQAIFDARGWLNKAIPKLEESPLSAQVVRSLRRNFGPTYGVAANASLIGGRLKAGRRALGTMPFSCDTAGTTALCQAQHCGWAVPGSNAATICTNPPSTLGVPFPFAAGCVLHESLHAAMSFMTVDHYRGTEGYPGPGTDPLLNAASYTELAKDLS